MRKIIWCGGRVELDTNLGGIYGYHMSDSVKTTVYLDTADYKRLKSLAKTHGRSAAELVREAVAVYARTHHTSLRPSSIGSARSGRSDLSARAEELIADMGRDG